MSQDRAGPAVVVGYRRLFNRCRLRFTLRDLQGFVQYRNGNDANRAGGGRCRAGLAIDSKLRACDLIRLRVSDIAQAGRVRSRAMVLLQQKTRRPVPVRDHGTNPRDAHQLDQGCRPTYHRLPVSKPDEGAGHLSTLSTREC